jgi:peptidoglycan-associated lipoprotein
MMRRIVVLFAVVVGAGCKGTPKPDIPRPTATPRTTSEAPVVPTAPDIAPVPNNPPTVADISDVERIRRTDIQTLNQMGLLSDLYFDLDQSDLRESDRAALVRNGDILKKYDFLIVSIEGHADERGTIEYNLALSERRARVASEYLTSVGVGPDRLKTLAYGKEIPVCSESTEDCWQRNRRAHFVITGKR